MSDELPEGWAAVALGKLVRPAKDKAEPGTANGRPYLGMEHVEGETGRVLGHADAKNVRSTTVTYRAGDVLYGKLRPYLNKVLVAPFDGVGSTEFIVFAQQPHIDSRYLRWLLARRAFVVAANDRAAGVQLPRVTFDKLADLEQPIPPLAEQRRIVAKVEALLDQVHRAKDRLGRVSLIINRFRQAVLAAALSGKLTEEWRRAYPEAESVDARQQRLGASNEMSRRRRGRGTAGLSECDPPDDLPESWLVDSVRRLVEKGVILDFQDGNHGSLYPRSSEFGETGTKFITAKQVFDGRVLYAEAPLLANDRAAQLRIGFARPGDVLLTHNATVGRVAILPEEAGNCVLGTSVTYYRLRAELMLPTFCMYFMQSRLWQQQLEQVMEQTTRNQVSVRKQAEFWMVVPPPDEQAEIARRVKALLACAGSIQQRVARAVARSDSLPQAILSKAFVGELVPTEAELARAEERDYETAEQLLERVPSRSNQR